MSEGVGGLCLPAEVGDEVRSRDLVLERVAADAGGIRGCAYVLSPSISK